MCPYLNFPGNSKKGHIFPELVYLCKKKDTFFTSRAVCEKHVFLFDQAPCRTAAGLFIIVIVSVIVLIVLLFFICIRIIVFIFII